MNSSIPFDLLHINQDLFRGSMQSLSTQAIVHALLWLRGQTPYPYPSSIHLDLTFKCSGHCNHCKQWTWPDHPEFTISAVGQLFATFKSWGVRTITFGGGNPLLHDDVILALRMAKQADMEVGIISEGNLMSNDLATAICRDARWIRFSLDGPDPDIHDWIRNTPGLFTLVMSSIENLTSRGSQLHVGMNCVVQKKNLRSLSQMIDLAERAGVDALVFKVPHGDEGGSRFLLSASEWDLFVAWVHRAVQRTTRVKTNLRELSGLLGPVLRRQDAVQGKPVHSFYLQNQVHCFVPLFFLACAPQGNMYPCDYLQADTRPWSGRYGDMRNEFCLGNVLENSHTVLDNLAKLMHSRIHGLPASGYAECGCCTRFCQLNASLTKVNHDLEHYPITDRVVSDYLLQIRAKQSDLNFL